MRFVFVYAIYITHGRPLQERWDSVFECSSRASSASAGADSAGCPGAKISAHHSDLTVFLPHVCTW